MSQKSQTERIRKHLEQGKSITPFIAFRRFGCLRLSERIRECESMLGIRIPRKWRNVKNDAGKITRVMSYSLA